MAPKYNKRMYAGRLVSDLRNIDMGSFQKAIITIKTFQSNHGPPLRRKCVININFVAFRNVLLGHMRLLRCGNELRGIERRAINQMCVVLWCLWRAQEIYTLLIYTHEQLFIINQKYRSVTIALTHLVYTFQNIPFSRKILILL